MEDERIWGTREVRAIAKKTNRQLLTEERVLEAEKSVFLVSSHFVQFDVMNVRIESGTAMEGRRFSLGAGGTLMAGSSANYQGRELFFFLLGRPICSWYVPASFTCRQS